MSALPDELRRLIQSGPMAHLSTINPDGSPQVTVIWIGLDGDEVVSGHMRHHRKLRNIERDPRVVLSFDGPRDHDAFLNPYAVLRTRATVEPSDGAWNLLNRLAKVYLSPDSEFPAANGAGLHRPLHNRADQRRGPLDRPAARLDLGRVRQPQRQTPVGSCLRCNPIAPRRRSA